MSGIEPDGPKYRIEHASTGMATCQQASCKRAGSKIAKGELRIGTNTIFDRDEEVRWYMAWRHWACATKHQLSGLKEMTNNDATQAPGYDQLSPESQEQVRLAFENSSIVDKTFKEIRSDLAAPYKFGGEITDAVGYKIDMFTRPADCRAKQCANKIVRGQLRVGFLKPFDGDHSSWIYKHWNCISQYDINALKACHKQDRSGELDNTEGHGGPEGLDGLETIPATFKTAVLRTLNDGKLTEIAKDEPEDQPKKSRAKKSKIDEKDDEKPKSGRKKRTAEVMEVDSDSEPEYVPRKTNSRDCRSCCLKHQGFDSSHARERRMRLKVTIHNDPLISVRNKS